MELGDATCGDAQSALIRGSTAGFEKRDVKFTIHKLHSKEEISEKYGISDPPITISVPRLFGQNHPIEVHVLYVIVTLVFRQTAVGILVRTAPPPTSIRTTQGDPGPARPRSAPSQANPTDTRAHALLS